MTTARFLTIDQVAEELATSRAPRSTPFLPRRDLGGFTIGGRGQWHVERSKLEEYLKRTYAETDA